MAQRPSSPAARAPAQLLSRRAAPPPQTFYHVSSEVSASTLSAGLREINDFKPDVIIAVGGGAPMDAAKAM